MVIKLAALSLLFINTVQASVELVIDEKAPLHATFSWQSHNRISIENGSVRKVFGDQSLFSVTIDDGIGQAFVSLLQEIPDTSAILTVVTSTGLVQDILITSETKSSEHLILKEKMEVLDDLPQFSTDFHAVTIDFLNHLLSGKTPLGYGKREIQVGDKLDLPIPLEAKVLRVLEGPYETIALYQISNAGRKPIVIEANSIKKAGDNWVFLDAHELDFTQSALCIISTPKD